MLSIFSKLLALLAVIDCVLLLVFLVDSGIPTLVSIVTILLMKNNEVCQIVMIFKGWSTPLVQLFGANDASTEGERRKLQKASKVFVVLRSGCQEIS